MVSKEAQTVNDTDNQGNVIWACAGGCGAQIEMDLTDKSEYQHTKEAHRGRDGMIYCLKCLDTQVEDRRV